ncbi:hypothetical protein CDAR_67941 [Caerostris darwini]|uniref:Uncharacterized protein n=1 Tax=Caerostris darwini TaxID=1538125 RepID=A0AAV4VRS6_9ARAC|nr:hypothetical protein CDAR_67941 [Caerostris darwini]
MKTEIAAKKATKIPPEISRQQIAMFLNFGICQIRVREFLPLSHYAYEPKNVFFAGRPKVFRKLSRLDDCHLLRDASFNALVFEDEKIII